MFFWFLYFVWYLRSLAFKQTITTLLNNTKTLIITCIPSKWTALALFPDYCVVASVFPTGNQMMQMLDRGCNHVHFLISSQSSVVLLSHIFSNDLFGCSSCLQRKTSSFVVLMRSFGFLNVYHDVPGTRLDAQITRNCWNILSAIGGREKCLMVR